MGVLDDLKISKEQHTQIRKLIQSYSEKHDKVHRYDFEDDMAIIDKRLEKNTQLTELILREIATEENNYNYKELFIKLYGHMLKYEGTFPEVN